MGARDVVEIRDHLRGVVDRRVIQAVLAKLVEVICIGSVLVVRELGPETAERPIGVRQWGSAPIPHHGVHQFVGSFHP